MQRPNQPARLLQLTILRSRHLQRVRHVWGRVNRVGHAARFSFIEPPLFADGRPQVESG